MTREEIIDKYVFKHKQYLLMEPCDLRDVLNSFADELQSQLSSDLDEAAEEYSNCPFTDDEGDLHNASDLNLYDAFKAGAEWMAGQGVSMIINDDTEWADVDSFIHKNVSGGSIIQIKKK